MNRCSVHSIALVALLTGIGSGTVAHAQAVSRDSPFMAPGGGAAAPVVQSGEHELVGIIAMSKQTLVGITNKTTRTSHWIPVGKVVDGIEVVSCEPQNDRATVRILGELKTLVMKAGATSGAGASYAPTLGPAPLLTPSGPARPNGAPAPSQLAKTPPEQVEQEREARMLVSDLLEIGIQQRKAYEEAQRKAAQKK